MSDTELLHHAWTSLLAVAGDLAARPVRPDHDALDTAESYRHLATLVGHTIDMFVLSRPEAPVFVRAFSHDEPSEWKLYGDNADTRYFYTNVAADHVYRIRGRRGDDVYLSFVMHGGHPTDSLQQRVVSYVNQRDLVCDADGSFEIIVSRDRPDGDATWLPMPDGAACILTREYYWDRPNARWAQYRIERIDAPAPPLTTDSLTVALRDAAAFLETSLGSLAPRPAPANVVTPPFTFTAGMYPGWGTPDNTYCGCSFDLGPDEVLEIEGDLVPSVYWNAQLWNVHMQSIGVEPTPSSVNRRQAGLGERDRFRVAVSAKDPGVRPWLDTQGHRRGTVYIRWLCADETPPTPTATVRSLA
jgi:hypothetical protein